MGLNYRVNNLLEIFDDKYYRNLNGGILEAFGILFTRDLKIYLYPYQADANDTLLNSKNIPIHRRLRPLYDYLLTNGRIKDLNFKPNVLQIFSRDILEKIRKKKDGWQDGVPDGVSDIIVKKKLFGMK